MCMSAPQENNHHEIMTAQVRCQDILSLNTRGGHKFLCFGFPPYRPHAKPLPLHPYNFLPGCVNIIVQAMASYTYISLG